MTIIVLDYNSGTCHHHKVNGNYLGNPDFDVEAYLSQHHNLKDIYYMCVSHDDYNVYHNSTITPKNNYNGC